MSAKVIEAWCTSSSPTSNPIPRNTPSKTNYISITSPCSKDFEYTSNLPHAQASQTTMNTTEHGAYQHGKSAGVRDGEDIGKAGDAQAIAGHDGEQRGLPPLKALSFLDRFLVVWIVLAMGIGIALGNTVDSVGPALQKGEFVGVSIPIAIGLLVMMYPILCKVRYETLHLLFNSKELWIQIAVSFVLNWIIAPLFMVGLGWAFLPDRQDLREGLIFVGIARCIAMVLIWTDLAQGDGDYCAVLVAFNSILQIILFAPFAVFYIQVVSHGEKTAVSYQGVAKSVGVFLGIPLGAAVVTRLALRTLLGEARYQRRFIRYMAPFSLIGLIYTIIVLFASQGAHVVRQITDVLRVCAPLLVYFLVIFTSTVWFCWKMGFGYKVSCTQSFTAASNNFELAIAVVVAVYGAGSGQALASTVGPLIEVPVLVLLVYEGGSSGNGRGPTAACFQGQRHLVMDSSRVHAGFTVDAKRS
ncbi:sodium bile acid symporter family-domain-containing protein [Bipolaris maydis]|nr:sodium bile acid symporter family-domain-containing protein [Bipolaris maydis]KAJ5020914.1 sodium bile acid symporter family-domain-containing protein [Bipolaris maydis]KAJ5020952.1 sodium bile acid symporter family-domain-containing protein [Bipolaris maydis]KAJ5021731.1 sodium bile acid symporter family-domain-containing protein [Bipolaris maydis]KAJ6204249.1 sodium bile acid symporter family-domain-containing protein [Bipolaris maydis]